MKKIVLAFLLTVTVLAISGCSDPMNEETHADMTSTLIEVETYDSFDVVYDKDTKVMYVISSGTSNYGNFTMLVNADGTPKLWKE